MKKAAVRCCWLGVLLLVAGRIHPVFANCVVCGSEGSCYEQPSTLSGNCECSVTSKFGSLICRPKGVCDPKDNNTCTGDPGTLAADDAVPVVQSRFLDLAAAKDALLASAIWGAMDQEKDARGILVQTRLSPGEHTGTMGTRDHRSFKYQVEARQFAETMFALQVTLEEEKTGNVQRYEGVLYHNGLQGELVRMDEGQAVPVVVWDFRGKPEREGRGSGSPRN
jgi:hypothetical protein